MAWTIALILLGNWVVGLFSGAELGLWVHGFFVLALSSLFIGALQLARRAGHQTSCRTRGHTCRQQGASPQWRQRL